MNNLKFKISLNSGIQDKTVNDKFFIHKLNNFK
jgi:hypothetical protein